MPLFSERGEQDPAGSKGGRHSNQDLNIESNINGIELKPAQQKIRPSNNYVMTFLSKISFGKHENPWLSRSSKKHFMKLVPLFKNGTTF